ncbi:MULTISPECIES: Uma2 family endonuclease [unclassified Microcoleus]|uniref:Uma2 family endonuclease n=1 Tax=unclassified Microcoleus TaxID=2642155 RepID=UPI001DB8A59B|nr:MULTISPECIES: Uma2 family endonuclease [unclassified Microcoleus]TAE15788.1 MAG: Uma2 family endonuclease [Oscillatoriales cyanobacterium]MCC3413595.1 Uma2 family endonuclease [Microcoleus sp. PH2017_02_FOX_O_A]MCC3470816.1 Uma2 family endonuclease [Microcoleus sp. PH2017_13_LAR_U_A]MCC3483336.1 Uma2 family endonuclease [Microcoleus sp. PH2017_14_LAR_D_A]MCC3490734.1 Uma2 family endonuclease [Microcoleus sp. PH2017_16_JOR_D_A]
MIATTSSLAEQRRLLENISWRTFETLLKEIGDKRGYRIAYDEGMLEIMTPSYLHESYKLQFHRFIFILAEELDIEIKSVGSTTLKLKNTKKGIEPDSCYYIQNEAAVRDTQELDLETAPPPDLAIEIDITSSSINKFAIYSALGVPELWLYNGRVLKFYQLVETEYIERDFSIAFPFVSAAEMAGFFTRTQTMGEIALLKSFRTWVKGKI